MAEWHDIGPAADIAEGHYQSVEVDDIPLLIFHLDGNFYALEDRCTHDDAELDGGTVENGCIKCPRHGACFDIKTGDALSAPAYEPTDSFECQVVDGMIQVNLA
jgi:3-phenylpropionate/trans-cinnamate dioxygenase ferredoxin subunit